MRSVISSTGLVQNFKQLLNFQKNKFILSFLFPIFTHLQKINVITEYMGKGDKKSKHGKIIMGSYGVRRPRRKSSVKAVASPEEATAEKPVAKPKAKPAESKSAESKPKTVKKPKTEVKPELPEGEEQA